MSWSVAFEQDIGLKSQFRAALARSGSPFHEFDDRASSAIIDLIVRSQILIGDSGGDDMLLAETGFERRIESSSVPAGLEDQAIAVKDGSATT